MTSCKRFLYRRSQSFSAFLPADGFPKLFKQLLRLGFPLMQPARRLTVNHATVPFIFSVNVIHLPEM